MVCSRDRRVFRGQPDLSGRTQAGGALRPDQWLLSKKSRIYLAELRSAFRGAFDQHYFTGVARRVGPSRERRESGRAHLLALAMVVESF